MIPWLPLVLKNTKVKEIGKRISPELKQLFPRYNVKSTSDKRKKLRFNFMKIKDFGVSNVTLPKK